MAQAPQEDHDAFTLRLPKSLKSQIDVRARLQHRTRNAEIVHLLIKAIDDSVNEDIRLKESLKKGSK